MGNLFKLTRTMTPEQGKVFFAMPFGEKPVRGEPFDFDAFYTDECVPVVRDECGMQPVRGDEIYGSQGVLDAVWVGMQQAELVVADFTTRSANVALEFGWAVLLGKRIVVVTQEPEDIPTDVRGLYRYIGYQDSFKDLRRFREELALQLKALREQPAEEMALLPMPTAGSMTASPARVILADREYVVVEDDLGRRGVLGNGDVDHTRLIKDMTRRFPVGSRLEGAFVVDPMRSEMRYTLTGGEANPWPLLARQFPIGATLRRNVVNAVDGIGVFVHLEHNVNGLVPAGQFGGPLPGPGTELSVCVVRMDERRRQVTLRLDGSVASARQTGRLAGVGWHGDGEVVRVVPEQGGRGGYLLVRLPEVDRPAMLLVKDMSEDLRHDLNNGHVELGEEITVEVLSVDTRSGKTLLRELPEEELPAAA